MATFGNRPEDAVTDKAGNVRPDVVITVHASESDALAQRSPLGSQSSGSDGRWPLEVAGKTLVWAREPNGSVWPVASETAVSDHETRLSVVETELPNKLDTASTDTQVQALVNDTGSATRGALATAVNTLVTPGSGSATEATLNATYGTKAQQDTNTVAIATKADADATPTLEEAQTSVPLSAGTISAAMSVPALTALFDCSLQQVSFAFRANVAASDANYWTIRLVRYRNGAAATIGTKTTKVTGGAGIVAWSDWNFDTTVMGGARALVKGDILTVVMTPTGAPAALDGPTLTLRTTPGATGVADVTAVSDTFTRANSTTSLGSTETGQAWAAAPATAWGVTGNQAYCPDLTAGRKWALVDTGFSDCTVAMTLAAIGATSYPGLAWRCDAADNGFTTDRSNVYRDDAGTLTSIATFPPLNPGDTIAVTCSGAQHTVKVNGVVVATVTDSKNQTVERHGMRVSAATGSDGHRLDNFKVTV